MKALVTGAAGFVGPHLVAHLRARGDTVVAVDRRSGPDVADGAAWTELLTATRPEAVYHLAGQTSVPASWDDPVGTFETNAAGTLRLLGAARQAGVPRVLVVSSADVYGRVADDDLPLTETTALRPVTPYAASKAAAEQVAVQAWLGHGLEVVIVRPFNHIGPGQTARFVAPALAERIAVAEAATGPAVGAGDRVGEDAGSPVGARRVLVGNLAARRDFCDVRDVVRAYRLLVTEGVPGEVYNVCSGRDVAISELAELLTGQARRPVRLDVDPGLVRPVEVPVLRGDPSKLHSLTGWEPTIPLEQTLAELLEEARRRRLAATP